jgi:hypothetical protein
MGYFQANLQQTVNPAVFSTEKHALLILLLVTLKTRINNVFCSPEETKVLLKFLSRALCLQIAWALLQFYGFIFFFA